MTVKNTTPHPLDQDPTTLDPAVLSTLPQSMQLQIMEQMRDQLQAFNRDKFTSRSGQPENFSSFQLQTFLKASAFRYVAALSINRTRSFTHAGSNWSG